MRKSLIRKSTALQRSLLSIKQVEDLSLKLLYQFQKLDFSTVHSVHVFLPISEKKEPDTFLFIEWLSEQHPNIKIVVPKADFSNSLMTHHVYPGRDGLSKNLQNILEPIDSTPYNEEFDMVLIPMLAFDLRGYRVGYGKGFYDRFLQNINTRKVGLSFYNPIDLIDDVNQFDVRLDLCITPEQTFEF